MFLQGWFTTPYIDACVAWLAIKHVFFFAILCKEISLMPLPKGWCRSHWSKVTFSKENTTCYKNIFWTIKTLYCTTKIQWWQALGKFLILCESLLNFAKHYHSAGNSANYDFCDEISKFIYSSQWDLFRATSQTIPFEKSINISFISVVGLKIITWFGRFVSWDI